MKSGNFPPKLTSWSTSNIDYDSNASINNQLDYIADEANERYDAVLAGAATISSEMDSICSWLYDNAGRDISDQCNDASQLQGDFSKSPFSASDYYNK